MLNQIQHLNMKASNLLDLIWSLVIELLTALFEKTETEMTS